MLQYSTPVKFSEKETILGSEAQNLKLTPPLKLSTNKQAVLIKNFMEEMKFVNTVKWRQKTSMPIVQILSYKNITIDDSYPRTYSIQVQRMEKSIRDLCGIQLGEALYLIQQCLLGVQTISYKYHSFDFHSVFYGLNQNRECKVWINENILAYQVNPLPLPKEEIIIGHIVKMIYNITHSSAKRQLYQFVQQTGQHINIGFSEVHIKLNQFANKKQILVPSSIFLDSRPSIFSQTRSQIISQTRSLQKNSQYKIKFNFQSPLPNYCTQSEIKQNSYDQRTPQICHSQIFSRYSSALPNHQDRFSNYQISVNKLQRHVSVQKMLMKSHMLKNKLKMSKDSFSGSVKGSVKGSIKGSMNETKKLNFSLGPEDKSEKTCTSRTFPSEVTNPAQTPRKNLDNSNNENRKQILTSVYLSEYSHQGHQGRQKRSYINDNSNLTNKQNGNGYFTNFRNYNFGGILPLPEKSIKQSQVIEEQFYEQYEQKPFASLRKGNNKEKVLKSMVLSQTDVKYHFQNVGWDWDNKMSKLITEDDSNMKQSVYCGQEKRAEHLHIKLEKLGKLGRQITSTVMHQTFQH